MKTLARMLLQIAAVSVLLFAGPVNSQATLVHPVSYDMMNGSGVARGGEYNYWDATYSVNGAIPANATVDGAQLSGGSGKLTDGVIADQSHSWEWTDTSGVGHTDQNLLGTGPYVGWTWGNPTITFHFGQKVNINDITFYVDNPGNDIYGHPRGGVAAPNSIVIGSNTYDTNKPSTGQGPMAIDIKVGLSDIDQLVVTLNRDIAQDKFWLFMSEVTFDDGLSDPAAAVPEPSTVVLVAAGLAGLAMVQWRKRKAAARCR
ncbi:PEP-CTERM sorting domain-containing protein [Geomesophilobacter sediminis]|uniref:PEP-CTERM sorting domain-containing protein n=1 Tax=Geomesophilobacter sediminis TaxID=2798584 RepID=A0A8J7M2N6_9BACT|nr:PEP-CTERM sorting domain-containing protein [Geomesophilobacter sediminis]MBJ6727404.1 PEP-CTERM sorting domain-containing protein [Geomesophilobacter sediminis]